MLAARGGGAAAPVPVRVLAATGDTYTGLTSRSWMIRFREHRQAAGAGSPLLFHRALRDALFPVAVVEHEVLRAGLTEDEALSVEEAEVEETSLFPLHPRGLNMVPGGRAGLRFLSTWWPADRPRPRPRLQPGDSGPDPGGSGGTEAAPRQRRDSTLPPAADAAGRQGRDDPPYDRDRAGPDDEARRAAGKGQDDPRKEHERPEQAVPPSGDRRQPEGPHIRIGSVSPGVLPVQGSSSKPTLEGPCPSPANDTPPNPVTTSRTC